METKRITALFGDNVSLLLNKLKNAKEFEQETEGGFWWEKEMGGDDGRCEVSLVALGNPNEEGTPVSDELINLGVFRNEPHGTGEELADKAIANFEEKLLMLATKISGAEKVLSDRC